MAVWEEMSAKSSVIKFGYLNHKEFICKNISLVSFMLEEWSFRDLSSPVTAQHSNQWITEGRGRSCLAWGLVDFRVDVNQARGSQYSGLGYFVFNGCWTKTDW